MLSRWSQLNVESTIVYRGGGHPSCEEEMNKMSENIRRRFHLRDVTVGGRIILN
jgi:hypothetical protein